MLNLIPFENFNANVFTLFDDEWFLLTSGDFAKGRFNCMTISWGSMGTMWNRAFAQVAVRPTRYTYEFIEATPDFSLCAFAPEYRSKLSLLGTRSGRDGDKLREAGLTPVASSQIASPSFAEASLVIECKKMYSQNLDPNAFLDPKIMNHYSEHDFHKVYFGEVLEIRGSKRYVRENDHT